MTVDQLSTTFAALADPTRRAILTRLAEGEATVNEEHYRGFWEGGFHRLERRVRDKKRRRG